MNKVLEIAKKNLISILCALAVLVLLVLTYVYPLPASYSGLQEDVEKSKATYAQLRGQLDQERLLPKLTIDDSPPAPLLGFPGPDLARAANKAIADLQKEAEKILVAATSNTGEIKPLTDNLFPRVKASDSEPRVLQYFRDQYWLATATDSVGFPNSIYARTVDGTQAPQQAELESIAATRTAKILDKEIRGTDGKVLNQDQLNKEIAEMRSLLPRELKVVNAKRGKVYIGPNAILPHPQLGTANLTNPPTLDMVTAFNAQYSLWIQELVLKAIADVNKSATNVLDAPIKHIVKLDIGAAYNFAKPGATADAGGNLLPPFNPAAMIVKDYRQDPFGHPAVNELYELNTFDLTIRVDATKIPEILRSLTSGRFLFINQVWVQSVDTGVALNEGFMYGPGRIAELRLRCNLLILRSQLTPWMPDAVKAFVKSRLESPSPANEG